MMVRITSNLSELMSGFRVKTNDSSSASRCSQRLGVEEKLQVPTKRGDALQPNRNRKSAYAEGVR
jgi:hypothetical protein